MAQFSDHVTQSKKNLAFLSSINQNVADCSDWQVTVCFYTSLHLVNAHLANFEMQYRKHIDVKHALNPVNQLSLAKLPEDIYVSYMALQSLSRRARYLVEEKDTNLKSSVAFLIYDKHLSKALRHLDKIITYFSALYQLQIPKVSISCPEIKAGELTFCN